jgi:hypothetical protein
MSNWTEHDHMTPEQEREIEAREECARRDIDPDAECADGGVTAWMIVAQEIAERRLKNKLVLAAYPAMDAVDAISKWCDGQQYANDTITVALLREMLPASPSPSLPQCMADWSNLPKDIYVIAAKSHGNIAFDVTCCSVPMIAVPEVRYTRADRLTAIATNEMVEAAERAFIATGGSMKDAIEAALNVPTA